MNPFTYDALPGRVIFGPGTVGRMADEIVALGVRRALVICDEHAKAVADRIAGQLGPACVGVLTDVRQHVPEELAGEARAAARRSDADGVLTIGGGSATGLGKAVVVETGVPLFAIPTTYAGSEMTPIYGLTGERKVTARDSRALPRVVVYDPELTLGLGPELSGPSGCNALAHAVEALYAPKTNPVVALLAEEAVLRLGRSLPVVTSRPDDLPARSEALYGAYLAGMTLAVAGTALHHKACHVLGGSFGLAHGPVHAVMLPYVMAYNAPAVPALSRVAAALGREADPALAARAVADLVESLGAPTTLDSLGMPAEDLERASELITEDVGDTNPRPVDASSMLRLLEVAYSGQSLESLAHHETSRGFGPMRDTGGNPQ